MFGIVLALISYFWYYAAVTIPVGALGYMLGAGLVAVIFARLRRSSVHRRHRRRCGLRGRRVRPRRAGVLVIVLSAFSGAAAVVNGVLILLGSIKLDDLELRRLRRPAPPGRCRDDRWIVIAIGAVLSRRGMSHGSVTMVTQRTTSTEHPAAGVPTR